MPRRSACRAGPPPYAPRGTPARRAGRVAGQVSFTQSLALLKKACETTSCSTQRELLVALGCSVHAAPAGTAAMVTQPRKPQPIHPSAACLLGVLQVEAVALGQPPVDGHLDPHNLIHQPAGGWGWNLQKWEGWTGWLSAAAGSRPLSEHAVHGPTSSHTQRLSSGSSWVRTQPGVVLCVLLNSAIELTRIPTGQTGPGRTGTWR